MVGYDAELRDNDIPFLAIPTTSGTGSEATRYSIFYVNEDEKHSVSHPGFLPGYVLLDPCFLQTVPDYQRKCTCLDALCHAIESYWSVRSHPGKPAPMPKRPFACILSTWTAIWQTPRQAMRVCSALLQRRACH